LLSFVEDKVAEIINKQNVDLKEWAKDVRKNINYRLQQATVYKDPVEAYKNTVVPWNMYRVVVLDENGVPISEYSNRYIDLVKLYTACYYSLREQGYDVEVYKPDNGVLTLVPNSSLVFADPGKKHNFSRLNNIASSVRTQPLFVLPVSQVSNDFGSNVFFVVSDKYDDSLNILCDGGAWLNQNSALGKAEFYVPVKYTIELTPGVNQIIPNKIFEFISLKKELEHATGQRRDEILTQLKNFAIESKSGRIIIGDKVVNANKLYITDVSVIGGEGFGVNLIISGNLALPSNEVSFNLGYGGAKYVPEVVTLGRSDIDLVCSLKQGDERWVEIVLNAAFTRLKEMSRKEAPLTAAQRQQLEQTLAKVKSAGIEVFQTDDGVIYQFRANNLDNNKVDAYRKIIESTDKLAKEVFGEGLLRTIKIRRNGHEYVFKGYYVLGYPTTTSAVYRYPISNGRLDAKFFEYISAKYGADVSVEMMKYLDSANKTTALSCYQALYSAFVDENVGNNFEEYKVEEEYLQQALKDNKIAQEIIRELLYTTPKKVALPEGIYLAGKEQKYVFFPSLNRRFIDKPYKFFNDLEKAALTVLLSPTQENVENYYRVLEEKTFTKDGLLSEIFEVHNDAVLNFGLVVPRAGQEYTTVEISREALMKFSGGEKLLNKLAKGEKVYAVVLRHPLISPDTLAVVELKLSNDNTPLKIHPVLWSVLKGDFDKDSAVLVTSDDMQKLLSSMYRQQQTLATAKLDKQIEEKRASLAEDYTHKDTFGEALEKVKKTKRDAAYDVAGVIGGSLRILTGNIHWSMYELREFVRSLYETCDLTPQDYLKYAEILWKIEQQPISGKKIADLFTNTEAGILNNPDVPIDTKLKTIESAFARNGLDVVIDLSRWNRARTVSPVRLGHLLKWQDFVSKSARLTSQDIDEFIMLTNLYFGQRKMGLSRYREGLVTEMTRAELLGDVPVGWHLVNTLSNRHPYSYWERIACEKLGIEFTPLPSEAVIFSGQSGEKVQGEGINRSAIEQTVGQAEVRVRVNNITSENPSIDLSNATGKEDVITQPAQQKTETRVEEAVGSPAEATFVAEKPAVESLQQQPSSTRGVFVHKGFPGNFNRGVVIVGDIHEARKYKEFVYTPKEIKNIVNEFNKKGVINGDKVRYVVDKLAYFDSNTGRYSKIPTQIDYSQFVICVSNLDDALKLVRDYKIPVLAIDSSYVKFNKRGFLKAMQNCIDAGVRDVYVYSPRVTGEDVVGSIVATLMGRVDLAVREFKSPWVKVPYSGYITSERIQQELTELNKKTLRNRIVAGITAGAITVGSYLGIDYFKKYQDIAAKTPPKVEVWVDQSAAKVEEKIENLARRGWETLRAEGRLPVNIAYDNLVGVKLAAYRSYFEKGLKQHLDVQNKITLRDLEGLSFDEVKAISLKAAKEVFEATGKVIVASEETEKSVPQAQQTQQAQQTAQQETQKTVVTLPVVKQTNPPVIDGITIRSIAVKRGGPTAVFVNFNNGVFIKCRAVQEGDKIRLIPMGLQANSKFMDFVTAWYTDWLKNSYDPQRGNGGYEEFTVESIDLTPEVDVVRQRNGKYIVSVFFGDALWFEKEIDVGPRGGISGLEMLPKNLRDEVRRQVREILNLPEPPAGPPIGGGLSMNLFKQLVDKANQGDEHARRVLELYKKDFPELYYKQAQRSRMYEPKYGNKDKIVYIIVSNRPQVGKSMVGNIIAGKVGGRYIATSDVLVEILAQKLGIKPEYIKRARAKNPEAYRKELIQLGDNLTRKRLNWKGEVEEIPTTPGEEALRKALDEGANIVVIDGIRRRSELRKVVLNIPYGYKCVKIGVFGYSESIDNTESGLLYDCDYVIFSRGIQDKKEVVQEIDNILSDVKEIPQHWVQKYKNTKEFVVVDLETTGLSRDSQIIQIAVLKCKKQGRDVSVTDKYVTRVRLVNTNLDRDTVEEVKRITGIDLTETANEGKDIKHVLVEIEKYLLNYPVVMHNAAFDLEVLNYWRQKYGMLPFTPKVLFDTKALAKFLYPASETHLETLAREYGVEYTKPHDAENDALVTAKVFNKLFVSNPRTSSAGSSLSNLSNQKKRIITNIY
jgi:DNA polymerase III epsilon subunit-like protein